MNVIFGMKSGKTISSNLDIAQKIFIKRLRKQKCFIITSDKTNIFISLNNVEYVEITNDTDKL